MNSPFGKWWLHAALAAAAVVTAQPAIGQVTFYAREGLVGRAYAVHGAVSNLPASELRDRAGSISVRGGRWQVCTEPWYRGFCVALAPGEYRSPSQMGLPARVGSAREVDWHAPGPAPVPGPAPGFGSVVLYERPNLGGRSITITGPTDGMSGFNDRARSMVVVGGSWELCEHDRYRGTCRVFTPGRYPDLGELTGDVSSARPLLPPPVAGPVPPVPGMPLPGLPAGPGWGGGVRVVLYEAPNFNGRSLAIAGDFVGNLADRGFGNRASSMRVERGYWMFCSEPGFNGECRTFGPGDYPSLPWALDNRISSGRRIANEYPYGEEPVWSWGDSTFGRER
jgi:hypothetical protein